MPYVMLLEEEEVSAQPSRASVTGKRSGPRNRKAKSWGKLTTLRWCRRGHHVVPMAWKEEEELEKKLRKKRKKYRAVYRKAHKRGR